MLKIILSILVGMILMRKHGVLEVGLVSLIAYIILGYIS